MKRTKSDIEKLLIGISMKIAKSGHGCMFVLQEKPVAYERLIPQDIKPFSIFDNERRTEALASLDGAAIIDTKGQLCAYGVLIKNTKSFSGYGTRHAAAYTASLKGNVVIMASEEDRKVRIFKHGKLVMQIDPYEKNVEYKVKDAVSVLESIGVGSLATIGASLLVPSFGVMVIPGIIVFGSAHYLIKLASQKSAKGNGLANTLRTNALLGKELVQARNAPAKRKRTATRR